MGFWPRTAPDAIAGLICETICSVAPMAGVTDRPFRQLCKKMGASPPEMVTTSAALR